MPIDSLHPQYQKALPSWTLVSDVLEGERRVKEKGPEYLPSLAEQPPDDYAKYRNRAVFVNVTGRTHETLVGFLFRKDPVMVFPTELQMLVDDCTLGGYGFFDWLKDTARAVMGTGRRGTLIEWDSEAARPFLRSYAAQQIINWRTGRVGKQVVLTQLVLTETSQKYFGVGEGDAAPDSFAYTEYPQWRVYDLLADLDGQPYVRCQVWRRNLKKQSTPSGNTPKPVTKGSKASAAANAQVGVDASWVKVEETYPDRRGVNLARIPFVFHGPNNFLPDVDQSPMENMARVNLSHYRTSADLENGRHVAGLPTPYAIGFGEDEELYLGSNVAWTTDKAGASCGFLEFHGTGLGALEKGMDEKEKQMATLGARMFDAPKTKGAEAYDTVRIKQTGETVTLTNASVALTQSCSRVLQWGLWWITPTAQQPEDLQKRAGVTINSEFVSAKLTSDQITALVAAWQQGAISYETLWYNMNEGEMYKPDTDMKDEIKAIETPAVDNMKGNGQNGLVNGGDNDDNGNTGISTEDTAPPATGNS